MRIPENLLREIRDHAEAGYPLEVCGVITGKDVGGVATVEFVLPQSNVSIADRRHRYAMDSGDLLDLHRAMRDIGRCILGYYHSHPDGGAVPSSTDVEIAAAGLSDGVIHVIVAVDENAAMAMAEAWVFRQSLSIFEREPIEVV